MSSPIQPDPDVPPGVDCPTCTPIPFLSGQTPSILRAVIHNVTACPTFPDPPNEIPIQCDQISGFPCRFRKNFSFDGWNWAYFIDLAVSSLELIFDPASPVGVFYAELTPCDSGPFANTLTCPGQAAEGGTGYILGITPAQVTKLALTFNLQPDPRGLYVHNQADDPNQTLTRLTGTTFPGSVLILSE